jgi:hypothetical protein
MELPVSAARGPGEAAKGGSRTEACSGDRVESANATVQALPVARAQGKLRTVIATAVARELSAFIWAINREVMGARQA